MATQYNSKIVTDGLIFYLDAANPRSYISGSTSWINLTLDSRIDGQLNDGVGFNPENNGVITFDGTNDWVSVSNVNGLNRFTTSSNYTVGFWVYINETQNYSLSDYKVIVGVNSRDTGIAYQSTPYNFVYDSGSRNLEISANNTIDVNVVNIPFQTNVWNHVVGTFSWTTGTLTGYVNGVGYSGVLNLQNILQVSGINIMRAAGITNYTAGRLAHIFMYTRALSNTEVLQNFNATRSRFGV